MGSTTKPVDVYLRQMIINPAKYRLGVWQAHSLFFQCLCATEALHQNTSFSLFARGVSHVSEKPKSVEQGIAALKGATDPVMVSEGIKI